LRRAPRKSTLLGAAIALAGLSVLSGISASHDSWVLGDTLVAICALAYAVHMIVLGSTGPEHDVAALTFVQITTVASVCIAISAVKERPPIPTDPSVVFAIVLTGVVASALAFVVQTWAQSKLPPARVALILVMEPAFGGVIGWTVAGVWPLREMLGAAMMLGGMIVSEALAAFSDGSRPMALEAAVEGIPLPLEDGTHGPTEGDSEPI
jgi:drug/metabolite transporter (DMT)-like permease